MARYNLRSAYSIKVPGQDAEITNSVSVSTRSGDIDEGDILNLDIDDNGELLASDINHKVMFKMDKDGNLVFPLVSYGESQWLYNRIVPGQSLYKALGMLTDLLGWEFTSVHKWKKDRVYVTRCWDGDCYTSLEWVQMWEEYRNREQKYIIDDDATEIVFDITGNLIKGGKKQKNYSRGPMTSEW